MTGSIYTEQRRRNKVELISTVSAAVIWVILSYTPLGDNPGILRNTRNLINACLSLLGMGGSEESNSAQVFMKTWVASGPNAALDLMDSRTTDSAKEVLRVAGALERFDGEIWDKGETTVTNYETGDQYAAEVFEVAPVVHWGEDYRPVHFWIGVTKDKKKVILVKLAGQH